MVVLIKYIKNVPNIFHEIMIVENVCVYLHILYYYNILPCITIYYYYLITYYGLPTILHTKQLFPCA